MTPATPCPTNRLQNAARRVREARITETCGRVVQLIGLVIESEGPIAALGEVCRIESARHDAVTLAEVVGFRNHHLLLMPLGEIHGIHPGSEVIATGQPLRVGVGSALKGRVIDGMDVVDRIGNVPTGAHGPIKEETPIKPVVILKIERVTTPSGGSVPKP